MFNAFAAAQALPDDKNTTPDTFYAACNIFLCIGSLRDDVHYCQNTWFS
jgi:hypothetical protein